MSFKKMESNFTFILRFCSALCAIITFFTRGRWCGLTWAGGMGCRKLYGGPLWGTALAATTNTGLNLR